MGDRASFDLRRGAPDGRAPRMAALRAPAAAAAGVGEPTKVERDLNESYDRSGGAAAFAARSRAARGPAEGDTLPLRVMGRPGNSGAATPSGGWLASPAVNPGPGVCPGTRRPRYV